MKSIIYKIEKPDAQIVATKELIFESDKKEKRAEELLISNQELNHALEKLKVYIQGLEKIMLMTSHKVRKPTAHIIGLSKFHDQTIPSSTGQKKIVGFIKKSVRSLDVVTRELTTLISRLGK